MGSACQTNIPVNVCFQVLGRAIMHVSRYTCVLGVCVCIQGHMCMLGKTSVTDRRGILPSVDKASCPGVFLLKPRRSLSLSLFVLETRALPLPHVQAQATQNLPLRSQAAEEPYHRNSRAGHNKKPVRQSILPTISFSSKSI